MIRYDVLAIRNGRAHSYVGVDLTEREAKDMADGPGLLMAQTGTVRPGDRVKAEDIPEAW